MNEKRPVNAGGVLSAMLWAGVGLAVLGLGIWAANTDLSYDPSALVVQADESQPSLQALGLTLTVLGGMLVSAGAAAVVICRALADR